MTKSALIISLSGASKNRCSVPLIYSHLRQYDMNDLDQLIELLDSPDNDYWGDVLSSEARGIIDKNIDEILLPILYCWQQWPENRLEHLAYLLGESRSEIEKKLVYELLNSQYESVAFRAREAASEFRQHI